VRPHRFSSPESPYSKPGRTRAKLRRSKRGNAIEYLCAALRGARRGSCSLLHRGKLLWKPKHLLVTIAPWSPDNFATRINSPLTCALARCRRGGGGIYPTLILDQNPAAFFRCAVHLHDDKMFRWPDVPTYPGMDWHARYSAGCVHPCGRAEPRIIGWHYNTEKLALAIHADQVVQLAVVRAGSVRKCLLNELSRFIQENTDRTRCPHGRTALGGLSARGLVSSFYLGLVCRNIVKTRRAYRRTVCVNLRFILRFAQAIMPEKTAPAAIWASTSAHAKVTSHSRRRRNASRNV